MSVEDIVKPAATSDLAEAKAILRRDGVVVLEDVLSPDELAAVRRALQDGIDADRRSNVQLQGFAFDPDDKNTRVFNLPGKSAIFRDLVEHPTALALASELLGEMFILSNFSANVTAPGSGAMAMHADQGYVPAPWPPYAMGINVAWALDDFTEENGGTRVVLRSHLRDRAPAHDETAGSVAVSCKAGSVFAMDTRVWHQTGTNNSPSQTRAGLFAYYVRGFIRPANNWPLVLGTAIGDRASPRLRELLGYERHPDAVNPVVPGKA